MILKPLGYRYRETVEHSATLPTGFVLLDITFTEELARTNWGDEMFRHLFGELKVGEWSEWFDVPFEDARGNTGSMTQSYAVESRRSSARQVLLPLAQRFEDLFDHAEPYSQEAAARVGAQCPTRPCGEGYATTFGPFTVVDRFTVSGGKSQGYLAASPREYVTQAVYENVCLDVNVQSISFEIIEWSDGRALVVAGSSQIVGQPWVAFIDPATIPSTAGGTLFQ